MAVAFVCFVASWLTDRSSQGLIERLSGEGQEKHSVRRSHGRAGGVGGFSRLLWAGSVEAARGPMRRYVAEWHHLESHET